MSDQTPTPNPRYERAFSQPWYAVVNDLIGGWDVANANKTTGDLDHRVGEYSMGCFMDERAAHYVAALHNAHIGGVS